MPWFEYEGLTSGGTAIAGRIEADQRDDANAQLAEMRIEVRELRPAAPTRQRLTGLTENDLIFFNDQLASLASAGIALDEGLAQLARDLDSSRLRRWIRELVDDLRRGTPLDQAIARREAGLPILYSQVIRAGIDSGDLPATLLNLNQHLRMVGHTRRIFWETATYPLFVGVLTLLVVSIFFGLVTPQFENLFRDFGTELPGMTQLLLAIGRSFPLILSVIVCVLLGAGMSWFLLRLTPGGRALREGVILTIPGVGRIHHASLVARFLRTVSTAVATGVPLPRALRLAAEVTGSTRLVADASKLADQVEKGQSIMAVGSSLKIIPSLFGFCVHVAVGREVLPTALARLAHSYENRATHTQAIFQAVLFPVLISVAGMFLFFAVAGMFLPLVTLINAVSGGF